METQIKQVLERVKTNAERFQNLIPKNMMDREGKYLLGTGGGWIDSFWIGMLYLAYGYTRDQSYLDAATKYQDFFAERAENDKDVCAKKNYIPLDHDTGFIFSLSEVARYKLTGDPEAKEIALKAADVLAGRYNEKGKFILAWDPWPWETPEQSAKKVGKFIVDSMMNVPFLMWAYEETGNKKYRDVAINHTETVRKYIVRPDFSTYHTFNINPNTGEPVGGETRQGYADESTWSRGHGWSIYGFALMYGYTKNPVYLETSIKLADNFLGKLTSCMIPTWDFDTVDLDFAPWDSSAGALAASGLLEVSKYVDGDKKAYYKDKAKQMLDSLIVYCSTLNLPCGFEPLLLHGCVGPAYKKGDNNLITNAQIEKPLIYGDYYFFEALIKYVDPQFKLFW